MSPIRPENRHRYGKDWPEFSRSIRFGRAAGRCECEGECGRPEHLDDDGRCLNVHGQPAHRTGSKVVPTVAHLCHTPECREHVKAMCQGCHLHYDKDHHAENRRKTTARKQAEQKAAWQQYVRESLRESGVPDEDIDDFLGVNR